MDAMEAAIGREAVVLEIVSDDDEPGQGPTSDDSVMEAWNEEDDQQRQQLIQQEMREAIAELDGQQIEITELDGQQMVASSQRRTLPDQPTLAERNPWSDKERAFPVEWILAGKHSCGEHEYGADTLGQPCPCPRPTFMSWIDKRNGRLRRAVVQKSKKKQTAFADSVVQYLFQVWGDKLPKFPIYKTHPVRMEANFYRKLPKKYFKSGRKELGLKDKYGPNGSVINDESTPDADNLLKFVVDSLNGIMWKDDKQVVTVTVRKRMDTRPPFDGRTYVRFQVETDGYQAQSWLPQQRRNNHQPLPVSFQCQPQNGKAD